MSTKAHKPDPQASPGTAVRESGAAALTRTMTLIATGGSLPDILDAIARCVEAEHPAVLCSILLLDDTGKHLLNGAGPSLPDFYNDAINGVEIGPDVGSCGTAAFANTCTIVADIQTDPLWVNFKDLAAQAGLASCWSEPIRGRAGQVLGTFAMYHREIRVPDEDDFRSIEAAAHIAAIAIERKQSEEALAASEARHRLFADNANDLIMLSGLDGRLTYISPSVARVTGYLPEILVGRLIKDLVHPEDWPTMLAVGDRLYAGEFATDAPRVEYRARHKDGRWLWFETRTCLIRDPETGEPTGTLDVARDVTARKLLEAELRERTREAEAATEAKSSFLANMSHEIRTPLTAILGFSGVLNGMSGLPEEARLHLQRITTAGEALLSVVNDVLDFSRLEAGQMDLDSRPFDPAAVVRETVDLVAGQAAAKQLRLEVAIDGDLPASVNADSTRLRQILLNLLGNALKFTQTGGVRVTVSHMAAEGGRLRIEVEDTGPGIPADRLDRLFQRFSQVDGSISRRHGGSGLGLAICLGLTELMGGRIGVESVEGEGSRFWFTVAAPPVAALAAASPELVDHATMPTARVLLVDDVAINRQLVRTILAPFGHDITEAGGGAEAVEVAHRTAFDLILMDVQMPGMDGLTATRAIRATAEVNRNTPILAFSANVLADQLAACRAAGMNDHIVKPINLTDLVAKVALWTSDAAPAILDCRDLREAQSA
ncbi:MAG: response regulator [Caulobacterales bacterium]|nr:response regulator [Caulobacterales bacterium]